MKDLCRGGAQDRWHARTDCSHLKLLCLESGLDVPIGFTDVSKYLWQLCLKTISQQEKKRKLFRVQRQHQRFWTFDFTAVVTDLFLYCGVHLSETDYHKENLQTEDLVQFNGDRSEYELAVALKKATEIGGIQSNWLERNVHEKKPSMDELFMVRSITCI